MPIANGLFEVIERVNGNSYKDDLRGDYGVLATLNVANLSPYLEDDYVANLRAYSSQQGEDDGDLSRQNILGPED